MAFILWLASPTSLLLRGRDRVQQLLFEYTSWNFKKASLFCCKNSRVFSPVEWGCGLTATSKEYINVDLIYTVASQGPSNMYVHMCTHANTISETSNVITCKCG